MKYALKILRDIGYKKGEADQLGNIGLIYHGKGELDIALKYHEDALKIDRDIGYRKGEASDLGDIGLIYYDKGELDTALKHLHDALKIFQEFNLTHKGDIIANSIEELKMHKRCIKEYGIL